MKTRFQRSAPLLLLPLVAACSNPVSFGVTDVDDARALWAENEPRHYAYTLLRDCFCDSRSLRITVRDGELVSVDLAPGEREFEPLPEPSTIEELFGLIEDIAAREEYVIEFRFDRRRGFPSDILADVPGTFDASLHIRVRDFVAIP